MMMEGVARTPSGNQADNGHEPDSATGRPERNFQIISAVMVAPLILVTFYHWLTVGPCDQLYGMHLIAPTYNGSALCTNLSDDDSTLELEFVVISDLDHDSKKSSYMWSSLLKTGRLKVDRQRASVSVQWSPDMSELHSSLAQMGRAMEMSDLKVFNGHLISVDDRTGLLYIVHNRSTVLPWVFLADGDGHRSKGFKAEWMAVKNNRLFVGSIGKEWTTEDGQYLNDDPFWVKIVDHYGHVKHVFWKEPYMKLRQAVGIKFPGYMIHESAQWSNKHCQWFFLPRRASKEPYSQTADEHRATNVLLRADSCFRTISVTQVGRQSATRGYSAFQFVPFTDDSLIVAIKSEEINGKVNSYLTVFDLNGNVILEDTEIPGNLKFEGLEFV